MISYLEAQQIISSQAQSFGTETISLDDADGRILAETIFADRDYPPFNRSAMDGYALRFQEWENGLRQFKVQEIIYAGTIPEKELEPGCVFKIMTGAAVPFPADTVIRREDSTESSKTISFNLETLKQFQNIARKGEDLQTGKLAITIHTVCKPAVISTLATIGKSTIKVESLPKIALFTTGNEVKPINTELSAVEIRNSNYYLLRSLLKIHHISPAVYNHLPDNKEELQTHIQNALNSDIIILSGGVSAGDADYIPEVLESIGISKLFHKVSIKPGKPIWCGKAQNGAMVFALPGNPFSTFVTFKLFIEPFLYKSMGLTPDEELKSIFKGEKDKKTPFDEFFPVRFTDFGNKIEATKLNGSGDIRLGIYADALAIHPFNTNLLSDGVSLFYYKL